MIARFEVGETVDVQLRLPVLACDERHVVCSYRGEQLTVQLDHPAVSVALVAPREWPPQPGDVWEAAGREWFARAHRDGVTLVPGHTDMPFEHPDSVLRHDGRARLLYRRGWSPKPEPAGPPAAEPAEVDHRTATITGLRELASWLEANPDVPVASKAAELSLYAWQATDSKRYHDSDEEQADVLRRVGALIGAEVIDGKPGGQHGRVERVFAGGVKYELLHVWQRPAVTPQTSRAGDTETNAPEVPAVATTRPGDSALLGAEEVAGAAVGTAPATAAQPDETDAGIPCLEEVGGSGSGQGQAEPPTVPGWWLASSKHANGFRAPEVVAELEAEDPTDVWVAVRRRGINYHDQLGNRTACDRATAAGLFLPLTEARDMGCPRCPVCQRKSEG